MPRRSGRKPARAGQGETPSAYQYGGAGFGTEVVPPSYEERREDDSNADESKSGANEMGDDNEHVDEEEDEEDEEDQLIDPEDFGGVDLCDPDEIDIDSLNSTFHGFVDIDDDEHLPEDEDDEVGDKEEEEDAEGEEAASSHQAGSKRARGGSRRPAKRPRISTNETAEQWIENYDQANPVPDDDPDMNCFRVRMRTLIKRICEWAGSPGDSTIKSWFKQPKAERGTTRGFRGMLMKVRHYELAEEILSHMPRKAQKVLGKKDLKPIDLLDMPQAPRGFLHRLAYMNIPVQVGSQNITKGPSTLVQNRGVKVLKPSVRIQASMQARVYVGSTSNREGGHARLVAHETEANKSAATRTWSMQYNFSGRNDVISNFAIAGTWSNPHVLPGGEEVLQDLERALPVLLEGLLMVYLGTYHQTNQGTRAGLFTDASYELVERLRCDLQLPDFHDASLNQAWPLMQGVAGGMVRAKCCANELCGRLKVDKKKSRSGLTATTELWGLSGPFSSRYCPGCYHFAIKTGGMMRKREGNANGLFHMDLGIYRNHVNAAWFAEGNPRQCSNSHCGIQIPETANIYGFENGIRCKRCHDFARKAKSEWQQTGEEQRYSGPRTCDKCHGSTSTIHVWDQERLCASCNTERCCFGDGASPPASPATFPSCANAACQARFHCRISFKFYVEDTEMHIWRCLICDWSYSTFGVEAPAGFEKGSEDAKAPGPIQHHRYNSTVCVGCGRYATFTEWTYVENIGYKCGSCCNRRCANDHCTMPPVLAANCLRRDPDLDDLFCDTCTSRLHYQAKMGRPKERNFAPRRTRAPNRLASRTCLNPMCDATGENCKKWGIAVDQVGHRCQLCHDCFTKHGRERVPRPKDTGPKKCVNPNCDRINEDGKKHHWNYIKDHSGEAAHRRCDRCHASLLRNGREWSE